MLLLQFVSLILGLASLVCFILTLIKMFQNNQTAMGIVCIVTLLVCGIGGLIAFILGWMNASNWGHQQVMRNWTILVIAQVVLYIIFFAMAPAMMQIGNAGMRPL